ncbi:MAG: DUF370 domain-containing protein [Deltaproteobacteria bacterium]|nr:DUF370 domain-containing protein [Deltaproteobacteria bacterium]
MSNKFKAFRLNQGNTLDVGFKNYLPCDRIVAIQEINSSPVRRMRNRAEQENRLIDASAGRREKSLIVLDSGHVVVTSVLSTTLQERFKVAPLQSALSRQELEEGEFVS